MAQLRNNEKKRKLSGPVAWQLNSMPAYTEKYMRAVLDDDPMVYWPGQDVSGHILDIAIEKTGRVPFRDSTSESTLTYRKAGPFKGLSFAIGKGSGGSITRSPVGVAVNNVSLEGWFNLTSGVGSNRALMTVDGTGQGWGVIMTSSTHYAVVVQGVAIQANNTTALTTGTWYHIVAVRDAGTWKYYLNGSGDNTSAGTGLPVANTTGNMGIGRDATAQVFDWAHFAYYETALSSTRALAHYNAGKQ